MQQDPRGGFYNLNYVPECYITQEICDEAVEEESQLLELVSEHFKFQSST